MKLLIRDRLLGGFIGPFMPSGSLARSI